MTDPDSYSYEALAARAEIADVMYRWCRAVDRRAWADMADIFHPDGRDDHGIYNGDIPGMIAWLKERHQTISRSMHFITNMQIEFSGHDDALVETYTLALQRYASEGGKTRKAIAGGADVGDQPFDMMIAGRYVDHFQRRDGAWRVFRRQVVFDNSQMFPVPESGVKMGADWAVSRRDADDPIWLARARLGIS